MGGHASSNGFVKMTICTIWVFRVSLLGTIFVTLKIIYQDCSEEELVVGVNRKKKDHWVAVFTQQAKPLPAKLNLGFVLEQAKQLQSFFVN